MTINIVEEAGKRLIDGSNINTIIEAVNSLAAGTTTGTYTGTFNGAIGGTTPAAGAFTTVVGTAPTVTSASPSANSIGVDGDLTLTRAGTISGGGNSFYGVRGLTTISSGTTFKEGFLAGMDAKVVVSGTMDQTSSTRIMALFAKVDASAGTLTAGQISAIWADMGSTAPGGGWNSEANAIRLQNTTSSAVNSLLYGYGKATYFADLSDNSGGWITIGTPPTTISGSIKVNVNGNTRYIPLYTSAS